MVPKYGLDQLAEPPYTEIPEGAGVIVWLCGTVVLFCAAALVTVIVLCAGGGQ
jgi:hypothetical protein